MKRIIYLLAAFFFLVFPACTGEPGGEERTAIPYIDTGVDPDSWALVPAGEFFKGQHGHRTMVDYDYEIMVADVTNAQYARYLNEALSAGTIKIVDDQVLGHYPGDEFQGYRHEFRIEAGDKLHVPLGKPGLRIQFDGKRFTVQEGYENHPMVMVTWFGAKAYCDLYGWRLPTEVEWEKAARGDDERAYPWGDEIARNQANYYSSRHLFQKTFGNLIPTTPVGYFNGRSYNGHETTEGRSPYGLYDMAGNVWQWVGDDYQYTHLRYMRGGSSANYEYNLTVWARNSAAPDHYGTAVGFRCARGGRPPETGAGREH